MRRVSLLGACSCVLFLLAVRPVQAAPAARPASVSVGKYVLTLINADRATAGLPPLHWGSRLQDVALNHSLDMAQHDYLSHTSPTGTSPYTRMARAGINRPWEGENIGYDTGVGTDSLLQAIDIAMMHSPEHRANILRTSFHHLGVGIAFIGNRVYVTEDFSS